MGMGTYKNIMELLVEEEVIRQCKALPSRASAYLNSEELVAYALNQLPPLYATSEQGLEYQIQKGRMKFAPQITQAVQRAIAAVRRDPLRRHTPLKQADAVPMSNVLQQMRQLLRDEDLEWETLPAAVERTMKRIAFRSARGGSSAPSNAAAQRTVTAQPTADRFAQPPQADRPTVSRSAQTGKASAAIRPVAPPQSFAEPLRSTPAQPAAEASETEYGWDDPLYFSR